MFEYPKLEDSNSTSDSINCCDETQITIIFLILLILALIAWFLAYCNRNRDYINYYSLYSPI